MDVERDFQQAQILRDNQQIPEAVAAYQRTREGALASGNIHLAAESLHMIGVAYYQAGDLVQAEEQLASAEHGFNDSGEQDFVGMVLRDRGLTALRGKDFDRARVFMQQSIDILKDTGQRGHLGMSTVKLGVIIGREGNVEEAERRIREGIGMVEGTPDIFFLSSAYFDLARLLRERGKHEEARTSAEKSLKILNKVGSEDQFKKRREELTDFLKEIN